MIKLYYIWGSGIGEEIGKGTRPAFSGAKGGHWPLAGHEGQVKVRTRKDSQLLLRADKFV